MTGADEDERGEQHVDDGVVGNEDEYPAGVRAQKDVVLGNQHLNIQTTYPGKQARVARSDEASYVAEESKADDREEGYVGMNLIAIHLITATIK